MDRKFEDFENSIKAKHSFRFTPKYREEFSIKIKPRIFVEIALKAFEALEWDVVYQDETQIEAKRMGGFDKWTNKIIVNASEPGKVEVKSETLGSEIWDMGGNSKRVKLFIYAFSEMLKEYDETKLAELEKEVEKKDNMDDYEIPESLPAPKKYRKPQILIPIIGILMLSLGLAYLIAELSIVGLYVIGLYEIVVGVMLGFSLKLLMKLGNIADWTKIRFVLAGGIILVFLMNLVFQYEIILIRNHFEPIGFYLFMKLRFHQGLIIRGLDVGSIGLLISWVVQLGLTYIVGYMRTLSAIIKISIERVPIEVVDFAIYHFVKGKNEVQVKQELSKKGWTTDLEHQMVFDAIGGIQGGQILNRG